MYPDDAGKQDKCHCRHGHHTVVDVETAVLHIPAVRNELDAEETAESEQLAEESHYDEDDGIAKTVADSVEERCPRTVLHGKCFEASHKDTVRDDKSYIDTQLHAYIIYICFEDVADDGYQSCNNDELYNDTYAVWNCLAD